MSDRVCCVALLTVCLLLPGCGSNSADTALDSITVSTFLAAPAIATQPVSLRVPDGQAATLSVSASGGGVLAYQWRKGGHAISGATAASYALAASTSLDAGIYDVVVSNGAGSVTSAAATLTVASGSSLPFIVAQPASQAVALGASATLTVAVSGSGTMAYQWRRDGVALAGATAVSYTIPIARTSDAGSYDVVITNAQGSASSAAATLEVSGAASTTPASLASYTAAMAFYSTLTAAQQATVQLPWRADDTRPGGRRPGEGLGLRLASLSTAQLASAQALVEHALGDVGSALFAGMLAADDGAAHGDEHIAFLGAPSSTGVWMLQISARNQFWNLAYNGNHDGPTLLYLDLKKASFVVDGVSYDPLLAQRSSMADLGAALAGYPAARLAGASADSCPRPDQGARTHGALYSSLSASDQALVQLAIRSYVSTQALAHANTLLGAYLSSAALAQTYLAYSGPADNEVVRIEGPRLWIELAVQRGDGKDSRYRTIWRDKFADVGGKCA